MTSRHPPAGDVQFSVDSISLTAGRGLGRSFQGSPPPCPVFLSAPGCLPAFSCSLSVGCSLTSVLLPGLGTGSRVTRWPAGVSCLRLSCRTLGWRVAGGEDRVKGGWQCRLGPTEPPLDWPEGGAQAQGTVCLCSAQASQRPGLAGVRTLMGCVLSLCGLGHVLASYLSYCTLTVVLTATWEV